MQGRECRKRGSRKGTEGNDGERGVRGRVLVAESSKCGDSNFQKVAGCRSHVEGNSWRGEAKRGAYTKAVSAADHV